MVAKARAKPAPRKLAKRVDRAALAEIIKSLGVKGARCEAEDDLAIDADAFAAIATKLFDRTPIRVLRLWKALGRELDAALAIPELSRIEELDLSRNRLGDREVESLVHSPNLEGMTKLELAFCSLSGRTGAILAGADPRRMPALRELSLFANRLGPVGVKALAQSLLVEQLTHLDLEANHGGDPAVAELLGSRAIANLEVLNLRRNDAGAAARKAIETSEFAHRLTTLEGLAAVERIARNKRGKLRPWRAPTAPTSALVEPEARPEVASDARGAELLAKIVVDPHDPEVRGVYADWLLQHGDPRGELMVLDARLASEPTNATIEKKLERLRGAVRRAFQQRFKNKSAIFELEHGFVYDVRGQLRWVLERGAEMFAAEPIRELRLDVVTAAGLRALAEIPGIERVEWITIYHATPAMLEAFPGKALPRAKLHIVVRMRELAALLAIPQITQMRGLTVWQGLELAELQALVSEPKLGLLERLEVNLENGGNRVGEVLLAAPWPLARLDVRGCGIDDAGLEKLRAKFGAHVIADDN